MLPRFGNWLFVLICLGGGLACGHTPARQKGAAAISHKSSIPPLACGSTINRADKATSPTVDLVPTAQVIDLGDASTVILPPGVKLGEVFQTKLLPPSPAPELFSEYKLPSIEQPITQSPTAPIPSVSTVNETRAADYTWIIGRLEYLHMKKQWRVRYLSSYSDDPYGGVVALKSTYHVKETFKEGDLVRVQGQLVLPGDRRETPEYYVHELKAAK